MTKWHLLNRQTINIFVAANHYHSRTFFQTLSWIGIDLKLLIVTYRQQIQPETIAELEIADSFAVKFIWDNNFNNTVIGVEVESI